MFNMFILVMFTWILFRGFVMPSFAIAAFQKSTQPNLLPSVNHGRSLPSLHVQQCKNVAILKSYILALCFGISTEASLFMYYFNCTVLMRPETI